METVAERFLRYVAFDTQSDELSETCPSTEKQKALGQQLVEDMLAMGIQDAHMDEYGYVYGTVPGDPSLPAWPACKPGDEACMFFDRECTLHHNHDNALVEKHMAAAPKFRLGGDDVEIQH